MGSHVKNILCRTVTEKEKLETIQCPLVEGQIIVLQEVNYAAIKMNKKRGRGGGKREGVRDLQR